jgi:hypothetical protein
MRILVRVEWEFGCLLYALSSHYLAYQVPNESTLSAIRIFRHLTAPSLRAYAVLGHKQVMALSVSRARLRIKTMACTPGVGIGPHSRSPVATQSHSLL